MSARVLLFENDARFATLVRALLRAAQHDVEVVSRGESARRATGHARFDAIVVDLGPCDEDGLDLVRWLASRADTPILVCARGRSRGSILEALRVGASGYLFHEDLADRLVPAVEELMTGGVPMSAGAARVLLDRLRAMPDDDARTVPLTPREGDVLRELARGLTYQQVAGVLSVSANTVRAHVRSIYEKLEVTSRTEAVMAGLRMGLLAV